MPNSVACSVTVSSTRSARTCASVDRRRELVMGHRVRTRTRCRAGVNVALARRAEWHCMLTATGFIVMCVAASSTCTRERRRVAAETLRPDAELVHRVRELAPRASRRRDRRNGVPSGRVAAIFARCTHRSDVPPMPTPTIVGGHVLPPAVDHAVDDERLDRVDAVGGNRPSAGTSCSRSPLPFGIISISSVSCARVEIEVDHRHRDAAGRVLVLARERMHDRRAQRMLARRALAAAADRLLQRDAVDSTSRPIVTL